MGLIPYQQQQPASVEQSTGRLEQVGGLLRKLGLGSLSKSYLKLENSFSGEPKGLSRVRPVLSLSPVEDEKLRLVEALKGGWDGAAAEPVEAESIEAAREMLFTIRSEHAAAQDARVLPIADGRIQLEWHDSDRSLEFEFTRPGWVAIGIDRSDQNAGTKYYTVEIDQLDAATVSRAYDWFVRRDPKIAPWPSR
jgi:hypothetical protein